MRRAVLVVIASLLALVASPAVPAGLAQPVPTAAPSAYDTVSSCLRERGHLLVLALIDESGSLRSTDPDNRRVAALEAALRSFAQFGRGPDSSDAPTIELQLAGFATDFTEASPWSPLNRDTLSDVERRAESFAGRNGGRDTDFAAALDGARASFVRKESEVIAGGRPAPCRLLLLFTDGQYDIEPRDGPSPRYARDIPLRDDKRVEEAGRRFLCDPGGIADQLRASETVVVAIALRPDAPPAPDQAFLRDIAEGQVSGGAACGQLRAPPGVLVEAQGLAGLLEAFDTAVTQALGGTRVDSPPDTPVCAPTAVDARCERTFQVDAALSEFHILVNLGRPGVAVDVIPPGGAAERLRAGEDRRVVLGGATLDVVAASAVDLVVDGALPPTDEGWVGTWTVRFVDETGTNADVVTRSQITVFGGLTAVVDPQPVFRAGESTSFDVRVVDAEGSPRTPAEFVASAQVRATVIASDGSRTDLPLTGPAANGSYRTRHDVPADATDPAVDLELTLDVTTRGGLALRPRVQTYQIPVQPPAGYPLITPTELVLSPILQEGAASGTVTVTGTPGGTGCVWFDGLDPVTAPDGAGAVTAAFGPAATDQASCVRVEPGQSVVVTVRATPQSVRSGVVQCGIRVRSTGADPAVRATTLPVRFEMEREPVIGVLVGLLVGLLLLGWLLPLVLLWLLNRYLARFGSPGLLRRATKEVRVTADDVEVLDPGWSHPISRDFTAVPGPRSDAPVEPTRSFGDDDLLFEARVPWVPLRLPYGRVGSEGRDVFASGGVERAGRRRGRVTFGLSPTWVFVVDRVERRASYEGEADHVVTGRLYLYVTDGDVETKGHQIWEKARRELPPMVATAVPDLQDGGYAGVGARSDGEPPPDDDLFVPPTGRG